MIQKIFDSVIEEIHRTREEISERFNGSINAIAEDAAGRQAMENRPVWQSKKTDKALHITANSGDSLSFGGR
jgi:hypothetical protein